MWEIEYWEGERGNQPIVDFVESLPIQAQAKVANTFDLLEQYGVRIGATHFKKMTNQQFWELRILGSNNIRFFYIAILKQKFLILHGFIKKSDKTALKDIKVARQRLAEYRNRD